MYMVSAFMIALGDHMNKKEYKEEILRYNTLLIRLQEQYDMLLNIMIVREENTGMWVSKETLSSDKPHKKGTNMWTI